MPCRKGSTVTRCYVRMRKSEIEKQHVTRIYPFVFGSQGRRRAGSSGVGVGMREWGNGESRMAGVESSPVN